MSPDPMPKASRVESLYDLLQMLKRKEICLEIEGRLYRGVLMFVGEPHVPRKAFATIKDVIHGNVRVPFKDIRRVWYRNKTLWHYITQRSVTNRSH